MSVIEWDILSTEEEIVPLTPTVRPSLYCRVVRKVSGVPRGPGEDEEERER